MPWRPELSEEEREPIIALFDAIDACSGKKPDWEIQEACKRGRA